MTGDQQSPFEGDAVFWYAPETVQTRLGGPEPSPCQDVLISFCGKFVICDLFDLFKKRKFICFGISVLEKLSLIRFLENLSPF